MDFNVLATILYVTLIACAILVALLVDFRIKFLRQKQKNYFLNRDRERYAETIYASKDGYFAFIYPDEQIKDPLKTVRERCSRRLAVMLNLKNGRQSSFEDVLNVFYKEDALKLKKYLNLMQEEGVSFEDTFTLKSTKRGMRVFGNRINALDGNLYCDMLWFRDLSSEQLKIEDLESQSAQKDKYIQTLEYLLDNINTPVYLKNHQQKLSAVNKKYADLLGALDKKSVLTVHEKAEWEKVSDELSQIAAQTNQPQKKEIQIVFDGMPHYFEMCENPFHHTDKLDEIGTVGQLIDITALMDVKRNFKVHQNAHLEILSVLGTAFSIFDTKSELIFYNKSFAQMWHLTPEDLDRKLSYASFLNLIRNKKILPDVSDFKEYKKSQEALFSTLIEPKESLLHLPDDRTLRRFVAPHPNGLIFAYEDVSDKMAAERTINELMTVQQNILDQTSEAVLLFSSDGRLKYFNAAYVKLFDADELKLRDLPSVTDVFETQKSFFQKVENWENLKQHMFHHIFEICAPFRLERDDGIVLEVKPTVLADETLMLCYHQKEFV